MIQNYTSAIFELLGVAGGMLMGLALPAAILVGVVVVTLTLAVLFRLDLPWLHGVAWRVYLRGALGYGALAAAGLAVWAALGQALPLARQDLQWRDSAESTANPVPDAPPVVQAGPVIAGLTERTYTRRLTLPPQLVERLGAEGVGVLAPYLTDPTTENVLRLVDSFRRSGQDVVFTRDTTRLDEDPIPFTNSQVRLKLRRLAGRAFDAEFEGTYHFENSSTDPINARFQFSLPDAGTVRDLNVTVSGTALEEPSSEGVFEWRGELAPGDRRVATVRYKVLGVKSWRYELGSRRRRVEQFRMDVDAGGPARFLRGSLQPTTISGGSLRWNLSNVVSAQNIALELPSDTVGRESYLQALSALQPALLVFLIGVPLLGVRLRRALEPGTFARAFLPFAFGLGAAPVLANYVGPVAAFLILPAAGALLAGRVLGRAWLPAVLPAALVPAALLSPEHSGLFLTLLAIPLVAALLQPGPSISPEPREALLH